MNNPLPFAMPAVNERIDRQYAEVYARFWSMPPQWISTSEIAQRTGMSNNNLVHAVRRHALPFQPVYRGRNGECYFDRQAVEAWISDGAPDLQGMLRIDPKREEEAA